MKHVVVELEERGDQDTAETGEIIVSTHASADVRAAFDAAEAGQRFAVDDGPHLEPARVCRSTYQSTNAAIAATMNTASWSELRPTPLIGW